MYAKRTDGNYVKEKNYWSYKVSHYVTTSIVFKSPAIK